MNLSENPFLRKSTHAFTLIELLVVIAIIGTLAALLIPAIQKGLHASHVAATGSNLRQVGTLMNIWAEDEDGWYPKADNGGGVQGSWKYRLLDADNMVDGGGRKVLATPAAPSRIDLFGSGDALATGMSGNISILGGSGVNPVNRDEITGASEAALVVTGGVANDSKGAAVYFTVPASAMVLSQKSSNKIPSTFTISQYGGFGYWMKSYLGMLHADGHVENTPPTAQTWGQLQGKNVQ